jgi:hypothetical protein
MRETSWNRDLWQAATANTAASHSGELTLEILREAVRAIEALDIPKPMKFDVYGSTLIGDQCYEIPPSPEFEWCYPKDWKERRMLIVPERRLEEIVDAMRKAGADVRVKPRYGAPSEDPAAKVQS